MEDRKEIILPSKRYKKANEDDVNVQLQLNVNETQLRIGERDTILDVDQLYDTERELSNLYKINGKLKMVFRNMFSGTTSYSPLSKNLYLVGDGSNNDFTGFLPYDEFAFLRKDIFRYSYTTPKGNVLGGDYTPTTGYTNDNGHVRITSMTAPYHNWSLYLTYVYGIDDKYDMTYTLSGNTVYNFKSSDGIPFRVLDLTNEYKLISPVPHGLNQGEYVLLSGNTIDGSSSNKDNFFYVNEIGDENFNSEKYVIRIFKSQFKTGKSLTNFALGKRCIDINNISNSLSKYYIHKHKTLTDGLSYIMDNIGFESPIFEDEKKILFENSAGENDVIVERNRMESVLFDFKDAVDITKLKNNLGVRPTELYLTTIFKNGNGYFNYPPKVGYRFNFHDSWIDKHFDGDKSIETNILTEEFTVNNIKFKRGLPLPKDTTLLGSYVEYNKLELTERIISETYHKLDNPIDVFDYGQYDSTYYSGATKTNQVGLYYEVHHKIKVRETSPTVISLNTKNYDMLPENSVYDSQSGSWLWKETYKHGFIDDNNNGTNFPFFNGMHYVKTDINLYLRNEKMFKNKKDGVKYLKNQKYC